MTEAKRNINHVSIEQANRTEHTISFIPVSEQIHIHALNNPDKNAVISGGKSLSYSELDQRSNQVANFLIKKGAGKKRIDA